ncbi:hypothetical protein CKAH01_04288 [Colletotrichum kahawae]|uniref:Uncharacterized protein n=1 Tax=Colletotrichum kahawae TaxID=34407 RepID=A0AAD9YJT5_COLKA|nr:hypothetical protein CKAH01_04288 [Colletotrichum kahawae]
MPLSTTFPAVSPAEMPFPLGGESQEPSRPHHIINPTNKTGPVAHVRRYSPARLGTGIHSRRPLLHPLPQSQVPLPPTHHQMTQSPLRPRRGIQKWIELIHFDLRSHHKRVSYSST